MIGTRLNYNPRNERAKKCYLDDLKEADQRSVATIDGVRKALTRFEDHGLLRLRQFRQQQAIGFKRHLATLRAKRTGDPLRRATVLSTLTALQEFLRWLAPQPGYKSKIAVADIRYLNLSRKDVSAARSAPTLKAPTPEQIRAALASMPTETEVNRRDRALVAFTFLTGIRDGAIATLSLKHINLDRLLVIQDPNEVATKFSKRIETFFFPVGADIEEIVVDWIRYLRTVRLFGDNDPVFPRTRVGVSEEGVFAAQGVEPVHWSSAGPIRGVFKVAFEAAGITPFTPHSFRRRASRSKVATGSARRSYLPRTGGIPSSSRDASTRPSLVSPAISPA